MGLGKSIEKLDDYYDRLAQNKVKKIKPDHVDKVLSKLHGKEDSLREEIAATQKSSKKERLEAKLAVVQAQIRRGEWLREEIKTDAAES
ncbi:hypothetical protein [uncultured Shimia sp.]|uniref:hypothetical protein n=1 Tax=uncultured Shimia sp. TaxID=573152 RepID=UPI00262D104F|nr:hypothetical protein [uncultured Shimia sp.]